MKISKLLNKKNLLFFLFFLFFLMQNSIANEPVDIWNIDKTKIEEHTDQSEILSTTMKLMRKKYQFMI